MTYHEAKTQRDVIELEMTRANKALRAIPGYGTGAMGMTPDSVKETAEWQVAKANVSCTFRKMQEFNKVFVKRFAKEIRADRKRRFELANPS